MEFMKNFGFQMPIFFRKTFHDFPKIYHLIHKLEKHKNFYKFLKSTDTRN